jgi:hypothetical protein
MHNSGIGEAQLEVLGAWRNFRADKFLGFRVQLNFA